MSELQSIDRYYGHYLHSGRHPLVWRRRNLEAFEQRRRHNGSANALEVAEKGQRVESERPALFLMCFFFLFLPLEIIVTVRHHPFTEMQE